mmetsp:Transcript_72788/g.210767  ORF Transcript_72788/g.210767 Transcript_72788/m.210767 type:complete len:339 (-) Transcript_72788:1984-3000(-)
MAADKQEGGDLGGENCEVDKDEPMHSHRHHSEDTVSVLQRARRQWLPGRFTILRGPIFGMGTPEHGLVRAHHAEQEQQGEADHGVHVLLPIGHGLFGLGPCAGAVLTKSLDRLFRFVDHCVSEFPEGLDHLLVINLPITIGVDLPNDPAHGIPAPEPDAVQMEGGQPPHAHDVAPHPHDANHIAQKGIFGVFRVPRRQDLLAQDKEDQADHIPQPADDKVPHHDSGPQAVGEQGHRGVRHKTRVPRSRDALEGVGEAAVGAHQEVLDVVIHTPLAFLRPAMGPPDEAVQQGRQQGRGLLLKLLDDLRVFPPELIHPVIVSGAVSSDRENVVEDRLRDG